MNVDDTNKALSIHQVLRAAIPFVVEML